MNAKSKKLSDEISAVIGTMQNSITSLKKTGKAPAEKRVAYDRGRPRKDAIDEFEGIETIHRSSVVFVKEQYDKLIDMKWNQRCTFQHALFEILKRGLESYEEENGPITH